MLSTSFFAKVLVRHVSPSFADALVMEPSDDPISVSVCKEQHSQYINSIQQVLPSLQITELNEDEKSPDCMFIEDTCVVVGDIVVVTQPGDPSRRPEIPPVRQFWEKLLAKNESTAISKVIIMEEEDSEATLDGGDVLFVPDRDFYETYPCSTIWCGDLFVGISARTNERGAEVLRKAFAPLNINVHNVSLSASNSDKFDTLHLKSLTTALAPSTLVIGTNETSRRVKKLMNDIFERKYGKDFTCKWIEVPDVAAANILVINGIVFFPVNFQESQKILEKAICEHNGNSKQQINNELVIINATEAAKADGALTCSCVLYQ